MRRSTIIVVLSVCAELSWTGGRGDRKERGEGWIAGRDDVLNIIINFDF